MGAQSKLALRGVRALARQPNAARVAVSGVARVPARALSTVSAASPVARVTPATPLARATPKAPQSSGLRALGTSAQKHSLQSEVHKQSLADPVGFWGQAALDIKWSKFPEKIFDGEGDGANEVRCWQELRDYDR